MAPLAKKNFVVGSLSIQLATSSVGASLPTQIKLASYNGPIYDMTVVIFKLHLSFPL